MPFRRPRRAKCPSGLSHFLIVFGWDARYVMRDAGLFLLEAGRLGFVAQAFLRFSFQILEVRHVSDDCTPKLLGVLSIAFDVSDAYR